MGQSPDTGALRYDASLKGHGGIAPGGSHWWLVQRVPPDSRVLDCGCAGGFVAAALVERGCTVDGLEIDAAAADSAREYCNNIYVGSLEDARFMERIEGPYDRIVMGDVLEHLRDPAAALEYAGQHLAPGGRLLISLPNIAHWSMRWSLLRGRFEYSELGLLDRTHLRFFTFNSARAFMEDAGWSVVVQEFTSLMMIPSRFTSRLERRAHRLAPNLFAYQSLFELRWPAEGVEL